MTNVVLFIAGWSPRAANDNDPEVGALLDVFDWAEVDVDPSADEAIPGLGPLLHDLDWAAAAQERQGLGPWLRTASDEDMFWRLLEEKLAGGGRWPSGPVP